MASGSSVSSEEKSEVFLLLEEYCSKRSIQRSAQLSQQRPRSKSRKKSWKKSSRTSQRFGNTETTGVEFLSGREPGPSSCQNEGGSFEHEEDIGFRSGDEDSGRGFWDRYLSPRKSSKKNKPPSDVSPTRSRSAVAERLVEISKSASIPEVVVEDRSELVQKLVELMITFGDDINKKIDQNPVLQEQLSNLNYNMFEKLTSSVQNLVQMGLTAGSEEQIQQQKISWAFEVTSRLSATGVVQRRRVLSFGDQYIQQHHSDWVQQHGGWDEVFDID